MGINKTLLVGCGVGGGVEQTFYVMWVLLSRNVKMLLKRRQTRERRMKEKGSLLLCILTSFKFLCATKSWSKIFLCSFRQIFFFQNFLLFSDRE